VPGRIPGIAFFPGGAGLWDVVPNADLPAMPTGGVMVLGHDFHSETAFCASLAQGSEVPAIARDGYRVAPTWTVLRRLFTEAGIPLTRCFFTNAYMGLRAGRGTTDVSPARETRSTCRGAAHFCFASLTLNGQPLVLTLGSWVPEFIAALATKLASWRGLRTVKALDDARPVGVRSRVREKRSSPLYGARTHAPELEGAERWPSRLPRTEGTAAEIVMLREAAATAGVASSRSETTRSAMVATLKPLSTPGRDEEDKPSRA
jgi:hypothetical protein